MRYLALLSLFGVASASAARGDDFIDIDQLAQPVVVTAARPASYRPTAVTDSRAGVAVRPVAAVKTSNRLEPIPYTTQRPLMSSTVETNSLQPFGGVSAGTTYRAAPRGLTATAARPAAYYASGQPVASTSTTALQPVPAGTPVASSGNCCSPCSAGYATTAYQPVTAYQPIADTAPSIGYGPVLALSPAPQPGNVVLGRGILGQPTAYVRGQPVRNAFRWLFP